VIDRRGFLLAAGAALAPGPVYAIESWADGRLKARPSTTPPAAQAGRRSGPAGSVLYIPEGVSQPAPLLVMLHGYSEQAAGAVGRIDKAARRRKVMVLAPKSEGITWDHNPGPPAGDVAAIDKALAWAFTQAAVDPRRIAVAGFSDGASMALSMGLINGDLFSHVLVFAGGRYHAPATRGRPAIFFGHGRDDPGMPYSNARAIARELGADYPVEFHAYKGGHWTPDEALAKGVSFFLR